MNNKSGDDIDIYWISIGIRYCRAIMLSKLIEMQSYATKIKEKIHNQGQHDSIYIYI
jgi:hypothetical protein